METGPDHTIATIDHDGLVVGVAMNSSVVRLFDFRNMQNVSSHLQNKRDSGCFWDSVTVRWKHCSDDGVDSGKLLKIFEQKIANFPGKDTEVSSKYPPFSNLLKSHVVPESAPEAESESIILKRVGFRPFLLTRISVGDSKFHFLSFSGSI